MKLIYVVLCLLCLLLFMVASADAQTVSGQISGRVVDPQGSVIPGATIRLKSELTQQALEFITDSNGSFIFASLVPGNYHVRVENPGFKSYDQTGIHVSAQERVDLHDLKLELGGSETTISVQASLVHVATDSSDRNINVTRLQIDDTPIRGRNFLGILRSLPGIQDLNSYDTRGWGSGTPTINGGRAGQTLLTFDGAASQDSGAPGFNSYVAPSVDSIAEVKVMISNYNAEYGARAGGQVNVTTKSGTNAFHGSGYFYWRNEAFNANEWFNNRTGVAKPRYRFENPGGTIGGPVIIPGLNFNKSRSRMFFFFSEDYLHNVGFTNPNRYTMPTALERAGDFSQTTTTTGVLIPIKDPLSPNPCTTANRTGCFANNIIPSSRFSAAGRAMMNLFPLPNTTDPTGQRQYNSQFINPNSNPREDKILRVDYLIGPRTTSYVRLIQDWTGNDGYGAILGPSGGGWRQFPHGYDIASAGAVGTVIHTFRSNLVSEITWGVNRGHQIVMAQDDALYDASKLPLKDANGQTVSLSRIFPSNTLNLRPNVNFGFPSGFSAQSAGQTVTSTPGYGFDSRWPFDGTDTVQTFTGNISWIRGRHNMKYGFYLEKMARNVSIYSTYNTAGTYFFGSDIASPVDSGYPISNLLLGSLYAYGEDNKKQTNHARYTQTEWFVQDTWKVHRRVTLDLGLRFHLMGALRTADQALSIFDPKAYDASKTGQLLFPVLVNGQRQAKNLVTGTIFPFNRQGTFDAASFPADGSPLTGLVTYNGNLWNTPAVKLGPRFGFAWDIFGNGKTAIRGGMGIFYTRAHSVDNIGASGVGVGPQAAPPAFKAPIFLNTTIETLSSAQAVYTPQTVVGGSRDYPAPSTYNWSFGIQQDIGRSMILDVAYVGNVNHHFFGTAIDQNAVPPFTTWTPKDGANPKYLDPTSSGGGTGAFYAANLIRSLVGYRGLAAINSFTYKSNGNYNALQAQLNKRMSRALQFGVNYTWSKTLTYNFNQWVDDQLTKNVTNRAHALNANFGYAIPGLSRFWDNAVTKQVFEGWRLNGIGTLYSGNPLTVSCGATAAPIGYWTGTPTGGIPFRCQMNGDTFLPEGTTPTAGGYSATTDPRLWVPFDRTHFVLPSIDSRGIGTTPPTLYYGPGVANLDLALAKEFRFGGSESRVLELKVETFNTFNHMNPNNPNSSLTLNFSTGANTNAQFGTVSGTQIQARRTILSLRVRF